MEQTNKIPDAINVSKTKNFVQIPNELLRNPQLSFKAKGLICLLLSNKKGWHSHIAVLQQMSTEGPTAIQTALKELETAGYLLRIFYRDAVTKKIQGKFWAYTDNIENLDYQEIGDVLQQNGLEMCKMAKKRLQTIDKTVSGFSVDGFSVDGFSVDGKSTANNTNRKNTNKKNTNRGASPLKSESDFKQFIELFPTEFSNHKIFIEKLEEFYEYRKKSRRGKFSLHSMKLLATKLKPYSPAIAAQSLEQAIEHDWTSVFPESVHRYSGSAKTVDIPALFGNDYDRYQKTIRPKLKLAADPGPVDAAIGTLFSACATVCAKSQTTTSSRERGLPPYNIVKRYVDWLVSDRNIRDVSEAIFKFDGKMFKWFLDELRKSILRDPFTGMRTND